MQKEVVILGGGVAGLAAAARLQGWRITVIEAKDRFGGRILTKQQDGNIVELGAEFVHGESKTLFDTIHAAHLEVQPVSDQNRIQADGRLEPVDVWQTFGELIRRVPTRNADESFASFLEKQSVNDLTARVMLGFVSGFNAADPARISVHSLRRAEYASDQMEGDRQSRLTSGYSSLVEHLESEARKSGAQLLQDVVARKIRWQPGRVQVEASSEHSTETFLADAAIITLPLGVLKSGAVTFEPALPEKTEAINSLQFGNVVKVVLVFRRSWWPDGDFGFIHNWSEPLQTWWSDPRGPVLTAWTGGPRADELANQTPEQLKEMAVRTLARLFSTSTDRVRSELHSVHTHNWTSDPFARGAYSYIPVNGLFLPKQLSTPVENTLFFAGEATAHDAQMGTVFGALESGLRAAREISG